MVTSIRETKELMLEKWNNMVVACFSFHAPVWCLSLWTQELSGQTGVAVLYQDMPPT